MPDASNTPPPCVTLHRGLVAAIGVFEAFGEAARQASKQAARVADNIARDLCAQHRQPYRRFREVR